MSVLTLLSDYGLEGPYIAEIKGLILKINPDVTIIDITHDIGNHELFEGALNLARSVPFFPDNTIHIVFANPDITLEPELIIIQTENAWFVGYNNGMMAPAAERSEMKEVYKIDINSNILPYRESDTFMGRDVLAPVGALLAKGTPPLNIGKKLNKRLFQGLSDFNPIIIDNQIESKIIHIDSFGNLITNITSDHLINMGIKEEHEFILNINNKELKVPYVRNYSSVKKDSFLMCLCGGYLELSVYLGNAQKTTGLNVCDTIKLSVK